MVCEMVELLQPAILTHTHTHTHTATYALVRSDPQLFTLTHQLILVGSDPSPEPAKVTTDLLMTFDVPLISFLYLAADGYQI